VWVENHTWRKGHRKAILDHGDGGGGALGNVSGACGNLSKRDCSSY